MTSDDERGAAPKPVDTAAGEGSRTRPRPAREHVLKLRDVEAAHIHYALQAANWNKREAARALGISRDTLYRKIVEHDLKPRGDEPPPRRPSTSRR